MEEFPIEISAVALSSLLEDDEPVMLIDCREAFEFDICRIDGAQLVPMRSIPQYLQELKDQPAPVVVFCHHGVRSLTVVEWLRAQGIGSARSLAGGIDRWSLEVDSTVPRY